MNKLAIVGDTCLDLTFEIAKDNNIFLIPYYLQLDDRHLVDQVDITSREFYERMEGHDILSTAIPPIQTVIDVLDGIKAQGFTQVIVMCASEKITGMRQLYEVVKADYSELELYIFDTNQIASSGGLMTLYAAQMNNNGLGVNEIITELNRIKNQTSIFAVFRTLKYVVKGGRFSKYKGAVGNLLNIHPLLRDIDGEVGMIEKVRGNKKSLIALANHIKQELKNSEKYHLAIFSGNNPDEIIVLKNLLDEQIDKAEYYMETELTPVLGVHAGPQSIGVAIMKLD